MRSSHYAQTRLMWAAPCDLVWLPLHWNESNSCSISEERLTVTLLDRRGLDISNRMVANHSWILDQYFLLFQVCQLNISVSHNQTLVTNCIRVKQQIQWGMLQRTVLQRTISINKIMMLQRTRRNTIGQRRRRVHMTCRAFPLRLERQS
jgi:hypothetical protein